MMTDAAPALEVIHQGRSVYVFGDVTPDAREAAFFAAGFTYYDRANTEWCAVREGEVVFVGQPLADARACTRFVNVARD